MSVWDLQSVVFSTGNAHADTLANARFPPELTATLQPKLLLKSVTLLLHFNSCSPVFLGHLHPSEACFQGFKNS